jgi:hypothetical protein
MFTEPNQMPAHSRIWIYQSSRQFTNEEEKSISVYTKSFLDSWTAHNQELKASFEIRHHLFLILMIDQEQAAASGCSIDKSIHFIQKIEKEFSVSLLDRQIFAIRENDSITLVRRKDFDQMIRSGEINGDTIIFNNLLETKNDLETKWEIPVRESWHGAIQAI